MKASPALTEACMFVVDRPCGEKFLLFPTTERAR